MAQVTGQLFAQCVSDAERQFLYNYCLGRVTNPGDLANVSTDATNCTVSATWNISVNLPVPPAATPNS